MVPKVSVIIPVYNVEAYIDRCVQSILAQSFKDIELILVDDGSSDRSGAICDGYQKADSRVKVFHLPNSGASAARNAGIEAACGQYIMFVDSDDYIDSDMLEAMLAKNEADIILSGLRFMLPDGRTQQLFEAADFDRISLHDFIKEYYHRALSPNITNGPYNKLYKKDLIDKHRIRFDETISICEDKLFVDCFLKECMTVSSIKQSYYNYVQYGANTLMRRYNDNAFTAQELEHKAKMELIDRADVPERKEQLSKESMRGFMQYIYQIYERSGLDSKGKREKLEECIKNQTFSDLLNRYDDYERKINFVRFMVKRKMFFLTHLFYMLRVKFRQKI